MSIDVMGEFDEVYRKPERSGHETQNLLRNKDMKDGVNASNSLMYGYSPSFHFC